MKKDLISIVQIHLPRCRICGHEGAETVASLLDRAEIPCPSCGARIDLSGPEWRATLERFARACRNTEADLARAARDKTPRR